MTLALRIVVADDEPDMREFLLRVLPRCGHHVVATANNGRQLVDRCLELQPDLIITDVKMPELDGIAASLEIARDRPTPVILVSAHHDTALLGRAGADHVMAYLIKPIGQADLEPAIAVAMRRFNEMQALRKEVADLRQSLSDR